MTGRARDVAMAVGLGLGLAACGGRDLTAEDHARERFVEALCAREGLTDRWQLMSREELTFLEGWSRPVLIEPAPEHGWRELPSMLASGGQTVRWMGPRAHLVLRGGPGAAAPAPWRLHLWGHVDVQAIFTRPRLTVVVDGEARHAQTIGEDGHFDVVIDLDASAGGLVDVDVLLSSVSEPWKEPGRLRVARLHGATWAPPR